MFVCEKPHEKVEGPGTFGRNFDFNISDREHHQDSDAFYGIAKDRRVLEIRGFACRENR